MAGLFSNTGSGVGIPFLIFQTLSPTSAAGWCNNIGSGVGWPLGISHFQLLGLFIK